MSVDIFSPMAVLLVTLMTITIDQELIQTVNGRRTALALRLGPVAPHEGQRGVKADPICRIQKGIGPERLGKSLVNLRAPKLPLSKVALPESERQLPESRTLLPQGTPRLRPQPYHLAIEGQGPIIRLSTGSRRSMPR
jgi:hypothetical protein